MSKKQAPLTGSTEIAFTERRAGVRGQATASSLVRLKGALGRGVAVGWSNGQPRVALVERRSGSRLNRSEAAISAYLGARLRAQGAEVTAKLLRSLAVVNHRLSRKGWDGVGALPAAILAKAIRQCQMLADEDPAQELTQLAERLLQLHAAALVRQEAAAARGENDPHGSKLLEVSEASFKEFEEVERGWTITQAANLPPSSTDR